MTARWRWFAVPAGGAALYLLLRLGLAGSPEAATWVNRLVPGAFLALACIGATLAAVQFKRGDYLRPAWGLVAFGFLCIAVSRLLSGPNPPYALRLALTVCSNAAQIAGTWLLARTWQVAGLELPRGRAGVYGAAIFVALIVAGVPLVADLREVLATGRITAWHGIVSSLGDGITFVLLAPITLTAITLRGGLTGWPWLFYAVSILCWLVYDLRDVVLLFMPGDPPEWVTIAVEPFRVAAAGCAFAAGMAQRWLARHET
jgi:hypothetical protein